MCGGSDYSGPYYVTRKKDIGLNIVLVQKVLSDNNNVIRQEHVKDGLMRRCSCWGKPYSRKLTEDDINQDQLTLEPFSGVIRTEIRQLIADRREYMENEAKKIELKASNKK